VTSPLVLVELGGAVGGPPAEHALSAAAARPRIGMVKRAAFIDILRRVRRSVGRLADRGGRNE
jgi:hypothetical protein